MNYNELAEALKNIKITVDPQAISEKRLQIQEELYGIKKYSSKYSVASHSKRFAMEFSPTTYELYNLLIEKLSEILPHDEDNGKLFDKGEFYLSADKDRNELIKITIQKTNGVSVGKETAVASYKDAQKYRILRKELKTINETEDNLCKIEKLSKTLAELLTAYAE